MKPRYQDVKVKLTGHDGNAFSIMGRVSAALRKAKVPPAEIRQFIEDCVSGGYDHLLQTCMKWVDVS